VFESAFDGLKLSYGAALSWTLGHKYLSLTSVAMLLGGSLLLYTFIGKELFSHVDTGQFNIQMRAASGTRIEKTEQHVLDVERAIREEIPPADLQMLISNSGVLYDWPAAYTPNAGPMDSYLMVQLREKHSLPSFEYARRLRRVLREKFPFLEFSFETGGL